jgi:hypothetical protein
MFIRKFRMTREDVKNHAVSYMWHKAIADQERAKLSIELLTNNAAGIGDHSTGDFHQNLDEALDLLVDALDRLEVLVGLYPDLEN